MIQPFKHRHGFNPGSPFRKLASGFLAAGLGLTASAQVFFSEDFNTDGSATSPPRYTVQGGFVSEQANHSANGVPVDQTGPVYWARNTQVSIVGVPGPTAERRAILAWDPNLQTADVSPQFWTLFDATINWLLRGKGNALVIMAPGNTGALAERLASKGHTLVEDDGTTPDAQVTGDLIIRGPGASNPSRFVNARIPLLTFSATDHDDMLVSTIGVTASFEAGPGTIVTPGHPAAGGLTGSVSIATGQQSWQLIGDLLPNGAVTVANFTRLVPPTAASFADVEAMAAGTKPSSSTVSQDNVLDYSDASPGAQFYDLPIPGGAANIYGLVSRGRISVSTAGSYTFAVGYDDGARFRIDRDNNGFTDADNVASGTGVGTAYGDVSLAAGSYDFELISFNSGGPGHAEVSISSVAGDRNIGSGNFQPLGVAGITTGPVIVSGASFTTQSYTPTGEPVAQTLPFLVLLNGPNDTPPGSVYGGGPFAGFEGTGYFAGSALNKYTPADGTSLPRVVTLAPVNVTGRSDLRLTIAVAGTYLDFETSDYLSVFIDPNNTGNFTRLIHFTAPSGADKYFDDRSTSANPVRLGLVFQDVTYPIPAGATQLVIQIRAETTWWNEIVAFDNIRLSSGLPQPPAVPEFTRLTTGDNQALTLEWTGGGTLQRAGAVTGPWGDVAGATSPHTTQSSGAAGFFRLRR